MSSIETISSSSAYTNALTINSSIVEGRRNFARPAETTAPGFKEQLSSIRSTEETEPAFPCRSTKANPKATEVPYEDSDFSLSDIVDILNPLQHIPVIGTLYRYVSGDDGIKPTSQIIGDMAYGGALGGVFAGGLLSIANALIAQETGTAADMQIAQAILGPTDTTETPSETTVLADASPVISPPPATETSKPHPAIISKASFKTVSSKQSPDTTAQPLPTPPTIAPNSVAVASAPIPTTSGIPEHQPYGGAMDTSAIKSAALLKNKGGAVLVGDTIYSSNRFNKMGNASKPYAKAPSPTTQADSAAQTPTNSAPTQENETSQLGKIMHNNANKVTAASQTGTTSNSLPPELVKDMMLMALDKYKSTDSLGKYGQTSKTHLSPPTLAESTESALAFPN